MVDKIKYYKFKREEKEEILCRLKEFFEREERIKLAYIFGDFTRRNVVRDIDVAVYAFPAFSFSELVKLNANVERCCAYLWMSFSFKTRPCVQIEGIKRRSASKNEK